MASRTAAALLAAATSFSLASCARPPVASAPSKSVAAEEKAGPAPQPAPPPAPPPPAGPETVRLLAVGTRCVDGLEETAKVTGEAVGLLGAFQARASEVAVNILQGEDKVEQVTGALCIVDPVVVTFSRVTGRATDVRASMEHGLTITCGVNEPAPAEPFSVKGRMFIAPAGDVPGRKILFNKEGEPVGQAEFTQVCRIEASDPAPEADPRKQAMAPRR